MNQHRKVSLFLLEILLSIFILSVSAAACIHVLSVAYTLRQTAKESHQAKELFSTTAELLYLTDGTADGFFTIEKEGEKSNNSLLYYYNSNLESCSHEDASYLLELDFSKEDLNSVLIQIRSVKKENIICSQEVTTLQKRTYQTED